MNQLSVDELLSQATCAVLIEGQIVGTAWLVSDEGHLLTAGYVLGTEVPLVQVEVQFIAEAPRKAHKMEWVYFENNSFNFAVLKLITPISRRPLPISLAKEVQGTFRLCGYGTNLKERSQYSGKGEFSGSMYIDNSASKHLFRLRSSDFGLAGNSGAAVFSDELQAIVGIQSEAAIARLGPEAGVVLAVPLYRVAQFWQPLQKLESSLFTKPDFSSDQISNSPLQINQLNWLTNLNLSNRELDTLPPGLTQLSDITSLDLSRNKLRRLPAEIGQLSKLTNLDLSDNQLHTLPPEVAQLSDLTELKLSKNRLRTLPPEIRQLRNLTELDLRDNRLPIPPEILVRTDEPAMIIEYYLRAHKTPLNEAKLLLVGQGRVGKTSVVKRLVENQFDAEEKITEGIAIKEWKVTIDEAEIKLNIWDFGGQEIMHATHQFFLTTRSLYLLVLNVEDNEVSSTLDYWVKLIESFGKESPIIVINNKSDLGQLLLNQRDLIEKYPTINAFVNTSCEMGWGISELETRITHIIDGLVHVRDEIPFEWLKIKEQLEGVTKDYISYQDYVRLCEESGVGDQQEQRVLIRLLHDLGVVMNFQDNPRLTDTSVLNPEWVTGGVYKIINSKQLAQNKGILEIEQLDEILDRKRYPKSKHMFIIEIMREFELCFDLEGHIDQKFLIPGLLPTQQPQLESSADTLNFEYDYDFLPGSVISRLMVRLHRFIFQDTYWRTGMVLVNNKNKALIKAVPKDKKKKIVIGISGDLLGRAEFLATIRQEFEEINASIKGLNAKAKILLPVHKASKCANCGVLGRSGATYCAECGSRVSTPLAVWELKAPKCTHCDVSGRVGAKFCLQCGSPLSVSPDVPILKATKCVSCGVSGKPSAKFCYRCGTSVSTFSTVAIDYNFLLNLQQHGIKEHRLPIGDHYVVVNVAQLFAHIIPERKLAEREDIAAWKEPLERLRLRVHPQKYYFLAFSLGILYYEELADYTLARQALVDGHQAIEALRGMVQAEAGHIEWSEKSVRLYEILVQCYLVEGDQSKAFEYAAVAKGRAFVNKLAEARFDVSTIKAERPDFTAKLKKVRQKRRKIEYLELTQRKMDKDKQRGQQDVLLREEAELWREIKNEYPVLTATLSVPTLSAAQACDLAKELDATLVEYYYHAGGWCAFVISKNIHDKEPVRYVALDGLTDLLLNQMLEWRNDVHLSSGRSWFANRRLAELYQAAIAPLGLKDDDRRVVIAPFERLHLLPLSAAYNSETKRYVAQDHILSFVPSLTALYVVNQEKKKRAQLSQEVDERAERLLSVAYPGPDASRNYLPNVLEEARAIVERLPKVAARTIVVTPLHEDDATPENVMKEAPAHHVIHFGCHGSFKSDKPEESGLMLASQKAGISAKQGSYLTVERIISELNLKQTRLTTLAACLTGEVALRDGEEHVGLLQAMMTAGVQTVVSTLWRVDDAATRTLFEAFYFRETNIHSSAQAMKDASDLLRQQKMWSHPYYWAAFHVNGLTSRHKEAHPPEWPKELLEHIKEDNERSIHRGIEMNHKLIEANAEALLKQMVDYRSEILHALEQQPLPDEIGNQPFEASKVGIAKALLKMVAKHPILGPAFSEVQGQVRTIEYEENKETQGIPRSLQKAPAAKNRMSEFRETSIDILQQRYIQRPAKGQPSLLEQFWALWQKIRNR